MMENSCSSLSAVTCITITDYLFDYFTPLLTGISGFHHLYLVMASTCQISIFMATLWSMAKDLPFHTT